MDYDYNKMVNGYFFSIFYIEYKKIIKLINSYIKKLEEKGEETKIRNIKRYFRIIRCLEGIIRITYSKREEYNSITDMYNFLCEISVKIICDIYEYIKMYQDGNYVNREYYEDYINFLDNKYSKDFDIEEWHNKFKIYTHHLHYII